MSSSSYRVGQPVRPTSAPSAPFQHIHLPPNQWGAEMSNATISKADLNALVYDYLIIEGFSDAAVEFARETGLPADVDHAMIQERIEIREAVEDGRVEDAVRRVNELDPEILDTNPPLLFHLHLLRLIELIRLERVDDALVFATNELAPRAAQNPEFLHDLERVMALLAFPDLARLADDAGMASTGTPTDEANALLNDAAFLPIGQLMKRSQRVKVAKELNAAILESQGQGQETKLSGLVRLMQWGEEKLKSSGITLAGFSREKGGQWAEAVLNA